MATITDHSEAERMRVVSWNVNGIRAGVRHGFVDFVDRSGTSDIAADTLDPTLTMPSQMSPARAAVHWALPVVVAPLLFACAGVDEWARGGAKYQPGRTRGGAVSGRRGGAESRQSNGWPPVHRQAVRRRRPRG